MIAEIEDQVFDSDDRFTLENGRPDDRATLRTRYVIGPFQLGLAGNYYGEQTYRLAEGTQGAPDTFLPNGPHYVLDADAAYALTTGLEISLGAENLLDQRPVVRPAGENFLGIFPFYSSSGLSMNGRYVYAQIKVKTAGF